MRCETLGIIRVGSEIRRGLRLGETSIGLAGRNAYRSGRNASWAKLAMGETRGFPGWKHLLFLSQKNSLLYSWSYHDESILHPGRLFTFGTSREGTYSRHGAYSGQGAYFYCESNRKLEDQIIFLKELCTHMDITVEKLRPRPLFL